MSYAPTTDFIALLRQAADGVEFARMPGLDFVVAAMARAGLLKLSAGQTAPTTDQSTTAWLQPAQPSWTAEGTLWLWNASTGAYALATPALWSAMVEALAGNSGYNFQSAPNASNTVAALRSLVAVQRAAPAATTLLLPGVAAQLGKPLQIADFSTGVTEHAITLTPAAGSTIMRRAAWQLLSTADQLAGVTLYPSPDLNAWIIAP